MDTMKVMETAAKYTYREYVALGEKNMDIKYELIDGVVYFMSPGASQAHQGISARLIVKLGTFLEGKPCEVFHTPFDVCLNAKGDDDRTTVQPDILVVCDKTKLDGKRCNGAPDMVIEILSPSNRRHDMHTKFKAYLKAGVREFWIVDPEDKTVIVYLLKDNEYTARTYDEDDVISVSTLAGCNIDMKKIFN